MAYRKQTPQNDGLDELFGNMQSSHLMDHERSGLAGHDLSIIEGNPNFDEHPQLGFSQTPYFKRLLADFAFKDTVRAKSSFTSSKNHKIYLDIDLVPGSLLVDRSAYRNEEDTEDERDVYDTVLTASSDESEDDTENTTVSTFLPDALLYYYEADGVVTIGVMGTVPLGCKKAKDPKFKKRPVNAIVYTTQQQAS